MFILQLHPKNISKSNICINKYYWTYFLRCRLNFDYLNKLRRLLITSPLGVIHSTHPNGPNPRFRSWKKKLILWVMCNGTCTYGYYFFRYLTNNKNNSFFDTTKNIKNYYFRKHLPKLNAGPDQDQRKNNCNKLQHIFYVSPVYRQCYNVFFLLVKTIKSHRVNNKFCIWNSFFSVLFTVGIFLCHAP